MIGSPALGQPFGTSIETLTPAGLTVASHVLGQPELVTGMLTLAANDLLLAGSPNIGTPVACPTGLALPISQALLHCRQMPTRGLYTQ